MSKPLYPTDRLGFSCLLARNRQGLKDSRTKKIMLIVISSTFAFSTAQWTARVIADVVQLTNIMNETSDTKHGIAMLNGALSAVDMTNALALLNVSNWFVLCPDH